MCIYAKMDRRMHRATVCKVGDWCRSVRSSSIELIGSHDKLTGWLNSLYACYAASVYWRYNQWWVKSLVMRYGKNCTGDWTIFKMVNIWTVLVNFCHAVVFSFLFKIKVTLHINDLTSWSYSSSRKWRLVLDLPTPEGWKAELTQVAG